MRFQCIMCFTIIRVGNSNRPQKLACPNCGNNLAVPKSRFETGCVIDDFVIESLVGRGGMATVYLARQLSMDRPVALKVLEANLLREEKYVLAFLKEAKAAARINHPNLVTSIAVGEEEGALYYAMEYVKGMTLGERLEREKTLDCDEALNIAQQCAEALHAAWTREGLIHRDIKPDNIILADDGYAKVMDLGIAITKQEAETADVSGTPAYMAPEQFSQQSLDCRTDIYSLGCTLYTSLMGYSPFEGETAQEIGRKHMYNQLVFPDRSLVMLPNRVKRLVSRMMAKDLNERFQTYDELLEEIVFIRKRLAPDENMVPSVHTISFSKYRMREELQPSETPSAIFRKRSEKQKMIAIAQRKRERETTAWPMSWYFGLIGGLLVVLILLLGGVWYVRDQQKSPYLDQVMAHLEAQSLPLDNSQMLSLRQLVDMDHRLLAQMPRSEPTLRDRLARELLVNHTLTMENQHKAWLLEQRDALNAQLQEQLAGLREERGTLLAERSELNRQLADLRVDYGQLLATNAQLQAGDEQRQREIYLVDEQAAQLAEWQMRLTEREVELGKRAKLALTWRIIDLVSNFQFEAARRALSSIAAVGSIPGLDDHRANLLARVIDAERLYLSVYDSGIRFKGERIGAGRITSIAGGILKLAIAEGPIINYEEAPLASLTTEDFMALAAKAWPADGKYQRAAFNFAWCMGDFRVARQIVLPDLNLAALDAEIGSLYEERVNEIEQYLQVGSLRYAVAVAKSFISRNQELPPYKQVEERLLTLLRGSLRAPAGSTALPRPPLASPDILRADDALRSTGSP